MCVTLQNVDTAPEQMQFNLRIAQFCKLFLNGSRLFIYNKLIGCVPFYIQFFFPG